MTVDLTIHELSWCWRHGNPIVGLRHVDSDAIFWVTLSPEDAQALSPLYNFHRAGRARHYDLLDQTIESLGGQISAISLSLGARSALHGSIRLQGPRGSDTLRVNTVDAIVLAWRRGVAISMDESDLKRVMALKATLHETPLPQGERDETGTISEPFRQFIESLDLGQIDEPEARA
jgi:bifunctional DNase/RNase